MANKSEIKNVQARIPLEIYEELLSAIKEWNENHPDDNRLNLQRVMVEALTSWLRTNQGKDPFEDLAGIINSK